MNEEKISLIAYLAFGALAGILSYIVRINYLGFLVAIAIFSLASFIIRILIGPKTLKWLMREGGWYFIGIWLIIWTLLYSLELYYTV
jgi:hypothetical protein